MDETLASAAVDISGRSFLFIDHQLSGAALPSAGGSGRPVGSTGDTPECFFQTDTIEDFWQGFTNAAGCNLHLEIIRGRSDHHKIEALFKAAARSLRSACEIDSRCADSVPSTKGSLDTLSGGPWRLA